MYIGYICRVVEIKSYRLSKFITRVENAIGKKMFAQIVVVIHVKGTITSEINLIIYILLCISNRGVIFEMQCCAFVFHSHDLHILYFFLIQIVFSYLTMDI